MQGSVLQSMAESIPTQSGENQVMKKLSGIVALTFCLASLAGCSATPTKPNDTVPSVVYDKPESVVQKAAIDALVANGFEIKTTQADYIEGSRPHKMGLVVGSGGESAGVWLTAIGTAKTSVKVDTAKSVLGIAGQKNWNTEILAEMDKSVGPHE
jgi:hypothetical protein